MHVLMIWTNGEVTSFVTGFVLHCIVKYCIGMPSWPVEQSFFISRRTFTSAFTSSEIFWKNFVKSYDSFILRVRRKAKDVKWLLISEGWSFIHSCFLFNVLCTVIQTLVICLMESALCRKLDLVSLIVVLI